MSTVMASRAGACAVTDPAGLTADLIRIDTTNPPGNEAELIRHITPLVRMPGVEPLVVGPAQDRLSLVARFPGRGEAPPLLLHAHADVVSAAGQAWTHPPFEGRLVDGEIWGRGAIDMKGGLAMMICALGRLAAAGQRPAGDVILAVVADEEQGSGSGASYLADNHARLFDGVRYAIGEEGGADIDLGCRRFHPVVVAEKRACRLRVTLRGPGGHASRLPPPATPMAQLGAMLTALTTTRLPRHRTPAADRMLGALADALPGPLGDRVAALRAAGHDDEKPAGLPEAAALKRAVLPEATALYLDALLRHTVNPTIVRTAEKINVVPAEITVDLDGRILPGEFSRTDLTAEVRALIGPGPQLEVLHEEGGEAARAAIVEPEFGPFYRMLTGVLAEHDPEGVALPMITPATTDAIVFARLGIRCYGWLPMRLPAGSGHRALLHAADERIPVAALEFGTQCLTQLLRGYP
jgi:acetylornithine deacetylase/succinyl-diaminopimelate desuccinylase-like protein